MLTADREEPAGPPIKASVSVVGTNARVVRTLDDPVQKKPLFSKGQVAAHWLSINMLFIIHVYVFYFLYVLFIIDHIYVA